MNNETIKAAAKEIAENNVRRKLTKAGVRRIQVMGAIIDGIAPLFNLVKQEIDAMRLTHQEAIDELPAGLWDKLSTAKKTRFSCRDKSCRKSNQQIAKRSWKPYRRSTQNT